MSFGEDWQSSNFSLVIISAGGAFTGLFVYAPAPGHGNLIASIAANAGTDPYGNTYLEGFATYDTVNPASFVNILKGHIEFGPVALSSQIYNNGATGGALGIQSGPGGSTTATIGALTGAFTGLNPQVVITGNTALQSFPTPATSALVEVQGTGDFSGLLTLAAGLTVSADGASVTGGTTTDTITSTSGTSSSPSVVSTDSANSLGTFSVTGITITEATYYLLPIGPGGKNMGYISIKATTSGSGPTAGSTSFGNTMGTAYRPATRTLLPCASTNVADTFSVSVGTGGIVTLFYPTAGSGHTFSCQGIYDLQ